MDGKINFNRVLLDALRSYTAHFSAYFGVLLIPTIATAATYITVALLLFGFSKEADGIDPNTFTFSMTQGQRIAVAAGGLLVAVVVAFALAASVHAASDGSGVWSSFRRISAKSMQIFWLQIVVYALALRFSPAAGFLLWLPVALGIPVALREDLGPAEAMDRAYEIGIKSWTRLLILEIVLFAPLVVMVLGISTLFLTPGPSFNLNQTSPVLRLGLSVPITFLILAPLQFMMVALTCAYDALRSGPALHARAASGVSS